ncbi:glycosyltransferase [Proteus terrae]|uniref:glycosyltransferase n=1 Tax=Proteus terrae TaxID=1574161 RepID=UPI0038AE2309
MKLLHVTKTINGKADGVDNVVNSLSEHQNSIGNNCSDIFDINNHSIFAFHKVSADIDLFLFHRVFNIYSWICILICLLKNKPYVIVPHSSFSKASQSKSKIKKKLVRFLFHDFMMRKALCIQYLSESELNDSYLKHHRQIIIPNGVDTLVDYYKSNTENIPYISFLARYDIHHKGIDLLLDAISQSCDLIRSQGFKFIFHGSDPSGQQVFQLESMSSKLGIEDLVSFYGPIFGKEKYRFLANSSAYILTSRYEGMPLTVLEALFQNTTCLVTNSTNMSHIIEPNGFGMSCETNTKDISFMIENFIKSKDLITDSRSFIRENYSWNRIALDSVATYKRFLEITK